MTSSVKEMENTPGRSEVDQHKVYNSGQRVKSAEVHQSNASFPTTSSTSLRNLLALVDVSVRPTEGKYVNKKAKDAKDTESERPAEGNHRGLLPVQ